MTMQEFVEYQERAFDAYFKKLIRNEAYDAHAEMDKQAECECTFSDLLADSYAEITAEDVYELEKMTFTVRDQTVDVRNNLLGLALASLTPWQRELILMFYFLNWNDPEIGRAIQTSTSNVNYHRKKTLRRLRWILEVLDDEE